MSKNNVTEKKERITSKYWTCVCYPENMVDDWESEISHILQMPFAYGLHDQDSYSGDKERKVHIHLFLPFVNTTTMSHVVKVANRLSKDGCICCPYAEPIINNEYMYNYLIHDTDDCRDKGKFLYYEHGYKQIEGNGFDIGAYVQVDLVDKLEVEKELTFRILQDGITNFADFMYMVLTEYDTKTYKTVKESSAHFDRIVRGLYHKSTNR